MHSLYIYITYACIQTHTYSVCIVYLPISVFEQTAVCDFSLWSSTYICTYNRSDGNGCAGYHRSGLSDTGRHVLAFFAWGLITTWLDRSTCLTTGLSRSVSGQRSSLSSDKNDFKNILWAPKIFGMRHKYFLKYIYLKSAYIFIVHFLNH
jgi:hypothetical protein